MINALPSNYANAVTPYAPLGRRVVGEENTEQKASPLKPLEASAQTANSKNQRSPDERAGALDERERTRILAKPNEGAPSRAGQIQTQAQTQAQTQNSRANTAADVQTAGVQAAGVQAASVQANSTADSTNDSTAQASTDQASTNKQNTVWQDKAAREAKIQKREEQQEREQIKTLASRDRQVRAHESAHAAVGGKYASAPHFDYTRGPNGVSYATSGEVNIDTSPIPNNPEATLRKAELVRRAATAPAEPSAQDRQVAAKARQMEVDARIAIAVKAREDARHGQADETANEKPQATTGGPLATDSAHGNTGTQSTDAADQQADNNKKADELKQEREARARLFTKISERNIDINNQLIKIGVIEPPLNSGLLFNQEA